MATLRQVLAAVVQQVQSVTTNANPPLQSLGNNLTINVATGWPPVHAMQGIPGTYKVLISVYDRRTAVDNTRWLPCKTSDIVNPTGITTTLSGPTIGPLPGTRTITIGGTPNVNDSISCVLNKDAITYAGQTYTALVSDGLTQIAAGLANNINNDAVMKNWVTASAVGAVVTLTNKLPTPLPLQSYVGNQGTQQIEVGRIKRRLQIVIWAATEDIREVVTSQVEQLLTGLRANFGVLMSDGTWTWILYDGDENSEDEMMADIYRRDFFIDAEYSATTPQGSWQILAPIQNLLPPST